MAYQTQSELIRSSYQNFLLQVTMYRYAFDEFLREINLGRSRISHSALPGFSVRSVPSVGDRKALIFPESARPNCHNADTQVQRKAERCILRTSLQPRQCFGTTGEI